MSAMLDIIIVAIIGLTIFFSVKNGFVKTVMSGASFLIALIIAFSFTSSLKQVFLESSVADDVKITLDETLADMLTSDKDDYDPRELEENSDFNKMLVIFGVDAEEIQEKWNNWRTENTEKLKTELIEYISEPIIDTVAKILAFLVLFLGSLILLRIVAFILDRIFTLPVLSQANKLLGLAVGIILAVVRVYLFCAVINLLLPFGESLDIIFIRSINIESTFLFKWFAEHNLFAFFFK